MRSNPPVAANRGGGERAGVRFTQVSLASLNPHRSFRIIFPKPVARNTNPRGGSYATSESDRGAGDTGGWRSVQVAVSRENTQVSDSRTYVWFASSCHPPNRMKLSDLLS